MFLRKVKRYLEDQQRIKSKLLIGLIELIKLIGLIGLTPRLNQPGQLFNLINY